MYLACLFLSILYVIDRNKDKGGTKIEAIPCGNVVNRESRSERWKSLEEEK
jgi:hypothetical protein